MLGPLREEIFPKFEKFKIFIGQNRTKWSKKTNFSPAKKIRKKGRF